MDVEGTVAVGFWAERGYSADEILGKQFSSFYTADDQGASAKALKITIEIGLICDAA